MLKKEKIVSGSFSLRSLLWVMLLSLTIIFAAIISSYLRYNKTLADYERLNHTNMVQKEITLLKSMVYETESSIRAYLILGDREGKPDLNINFKNAETQWKVVKEMTRDNTGQQVLCDSILDLLQQRYIVFSSSITGKNAGSDSIIQDGVYRGGVIMQRFTGVINAMLDIEYRLSDIRSDTAETGARYTPVFLLLASVISSFFIILSYILLVREYNKSVMLQQRLAKNVRDLNQSNKELEQFAYIASHDLQEPLRKLRSFSSILLARQDENLSAESRSILDRIDASATRMQTLIEDLLTFSRMLTKPPETEKADLNKIVEEVKAAIIPADSSRNIIIQSATLPVIQGYPNSLARLFQNLFSNSVKYAKPQGDIVIKITAGVVKGRNISGSLPTEKDKVFHQVDVSDNGIGFESEYTTKIFKIFQRLHNKNEYSGTGIGLAICKRVAENHDGYISASSKPGVGTTIHIYLPVA